ncbi:hypothetical protein Ahy_B01g055904 [Arachis hypogaea]|uniref:Malic enzyme NAD-binding domain-containing protein n=1 Tax=Arachis hypogaea TaxID=3818 RepID=A0A445AXG6_ARAHY|nr:hypothetical protein Ahy_B01g055904 [Arachis hypogaea]
MALTTLNIFFKCMTRSRHRRLLQLQRRRRCLLDSTSHGAFSRFYSDKDRVLSEEDQAKENVYVKFEDFANHNAFDLLAKYSLSRLVFNDDIQGTAFVVLARLLASSKLVKGTLADHTFLLLGAGEGSSALLEVSTMISNSFLLLDLSYTLQPTFSFYYCRLLSSVESQGSYCCNTEHHLGWSYFR